MGLWDRAMLRFTMRKYAVRLKRIRDEYAAMEKWDREKVRQRSRALGREIRERLAAVGGELPLPEQTVTAAYALCCRAFRLALGIELYNSQLVAALALSEGKLAEMQTGEGKTLAAVLPAYVYALRGKGAHVVTFNDYLAGRDAAWMAPVYRMLGLTVGCVQEAMNDGERRFAYDADITYVTAKQAGFDFLRDSLCLDAEGLVQRPFYFALVDEADSILIDEARVPLIIAGASDQAPRGDARLAEAVKRLVPGGDYDTDEGRRNVYLTESGAERLERLLDCGNLYDAESEDLLTSLQHALHAEVLLRRDVDYVVRGGKVEQIDEYTGRIADQRRWPDGLQAAVETKEGLTPQRGGRLLGTITLRHLFAMYEVKCGMTATARSSADEFRDVYGLLVVIVPPNRPSKRIDYPHAVFVTQEAKRKALIQTIASRHRLGRPVLVGTGSVAESNALAAELMAAGILCRVLHAASDEQEAAILARAGEWGAVTVSTHMAGRGVDIRLGGGNPAEAARIARLGGLAVFGTYLHDSVRIDNQLRGRAGRQGDPGSSMFYVSLEDDLLVRYGKGAGLSPERFAAFGEAPIAGSRIARAIDHIQLVAEGQNADIRRTLNRYADMLEQQRRIVAEKRRVALADLSVPSVLALREPELFERLSGKYGELAVRKSEQRWTLLAVDRFWSGHLEYAARLRETIHLESIGVDKPLDVFHRRLIEAFTPFDRQVEEQVVQAAESVDMTKPQLELELAALPIPSATWTYLVNDLFFANRVSLW